jgi:hypothetical protein
MSSQAHRDLAQHVADVLLRDWKGQVRPGNREWIDCRCPFHDDKAPSGSFSQEVGNFYCHAEGQSWGLNQIAAKVGIDVDRVPDLSPLSRGARPAPTPAPPPKPKLTVVDPKNPPADRVRVYEYVFPDGRPSHSVERRDLADGTKTFRVVAPTGEYRLPDPYHPIFEDPGYAEGDYLLVVEGEKCALRARKESPVLDRPIHAITWSGGAGNARKHAAAIAQRCADLKPTYVLLWPDHDEAGFKAMRAIADKLRQHGVKFNTLKPAEFDIPAKGDLVDFVDAGGSLADAFQKNRESGQTPQVGALAKRITVLPGNQMVFLGTRSATEIDLPVLESIWRDAYQEMPKIRQVRELRALLTQRSFTSPTRHQNRVYATPERFFWRGLDAGQCFMIDHDDIHLSDDPDGVLLTLPNAEPLYPVDVDTTGNTNDLTELTAMFRLNGEDRRLIEAWLLTTLLGLQTPIMLLRGAAGTGKTTLARALVGVVEPCVPEMESSQMNEKDRREFIRMLESTRVVLADNISQLTGPMEDTLSKLVTGYTVSIRTLYEDRVGTLRLQRSVILTTITYDMYKSDLASRTIAFEPALNAPAGQFIPDSEMQASIAPLIPKIRGHLFKQAVEFYRNREMAQTQQTPFRIGDLGMVLTATGEDAAGLAEAMIRRKRELVVKYDDWMEAIIETVKAMSQPSGFIPTKDLLKEIASRSGGDPPSAHKLSKYVEEKEQFFKDFGITLKRARIGHAGDRAYHFELV